VQRARVQQVLEDHPLVEEFWDDPRAHLGATSCRLVQNHPFSRSGEYAES
jgi:hypothetical protein